MQKQHIVKRMRTLFNALVIAALLAGLIPPPALVGLANILRLESISEPVAELTEGLFDVATAHAAPALLPMAAPVVAPLAQMSSATGVLTVTKTVDWNGNTPNGNRQFAYTIEGPGGFTPINGSISDGGVMTYSVPLGVYTVTETSPGAGWVTTYTVDSIVSSASAVVNLRGGSTQAPIAPAAISGTTYQDFNSNGQFDGTEAPVADVTVTVYGPEGSACGSTVSDVNGDYSLTPTCSGPWRVVFTGLPTGIEPSPAGIGNGTSTQFVTTSGATGLDFAANAPCDYCQGNPQTVGPIYTNGLRSTAPTNASVVGFAYNASGTGTPATKLAENEDTGVLYGIAYDRQRELVYASAFLKRHADLGPNGGGAIYQIDPSLPAASATSLFLDINGTTGAEDGIVVDTGATFVRDLGAANNPNTDANAFPLVGKWGLGDIEIDEATGRLYATNLNQRTLVKIDLATATVLNSFAIPNPGCATVDERRPFGLGSQNGTIYVGVVCDTTLDAFVMALQPDGTFANVVTNIPMNIPMPDRFDGINRFWLPWTSVYQVDTNRGAFRNTYPSPLLSDIDFDANGNMLLSFRDRFADQTAEQTNRPDGIFSEDIWGHSQILQACATGSGWTTSGACNVDLINTRVGENASNTGGLASLKVAGSFITGVADPINVMQQGTARWAYGTADEIVGSPYVVDNGTQGPPRVAKGNGLGDLELLCDPAPIEIGNRVWNDLDGDGEQDAGEPGLNNLTVTLQTPTGSSTTTTTGDGNYYFSVDAYAAYTITMATPDGYSLTATNTATLDAANLTSNDAISDTIDSDALLVDDTPTIYYTTGGPGQNNHGLDFGFVQPTSGQVDILNTAPAQQNYDLALRKRVVNQTANPDGSRMATYTIEVINQGDVAASNIELVDYLPANSTLGTPANGWTASGSNLSLTVPGPIPAGESTVVGLVLNIAASAAGGWVTNTAEIAVDDGADIDSTPDVTNRDKLVDDVVNDNPTTGTDEDDHDIAVAPPICPAATIWNGGVYNDSQSTFVANVEGLDWSSAGSGMFEGIGPIGSTPNVGTESLLRYQATLVGLTDPNGNALAFSGLNNGFEYTLVAEIPLTVLAVVPQPGVLTIVFATLPDGQYFIYQDSAINTNVGNGFGFDDGILIASGYVNAGQTSSFTYISATAAAVGSFSFTAPISYVNGDYIDPIDKLAEFRLEGTLNYPPLDSTTTTFFAGRTGEGSLSNYTVTGNDILLKVDTSSKLYECIPAVPKLAVSKQLNGVNPFGVGESISFSIRITNTGDVAITTLPLEDRFSSAFITFISANPAPDGNNGGILTWNNLLAGDPDGLAANEAMTVDVTFTTAADTTLLAAITNCSPAGHTPNLARVSNALAGGTPVVTDADDKDCASVQILNPTGIQLAERSLTQTPEGVLVRWQMVDESNVVGFYLWRSNGVESARRSELIPTRVNGQAANAAAYEWLDAGATLTRGDAYVLEIVKVDGATERVVIDVVQRGPLFLPLVIK